MKSIYTCLLLQLVFRIACFSQPQVHLVEYASGLPHDVSDIAHANDGRLFIAEQLGYIRIVQPGGTLAARPFLNIHSKVTPNVVDTIGEQGLLGLAFSPNYATDGNFYINYTNKDEIGNSIIARYHVSADPDSADIASEQILLTLHQPYNNHNGGCLKFGNDGYLYCGFGDGGYGGDPGNRAQNTDSLFGKILRLDVSGSGGYTIPSTNPFATTGGAPEVWDYGFRNPWRFSFDRLKHDLWIADVGQDSMEEVDFEAVPSAGGINYGWRCYEGVRAYNTAGCSGRFEAPVYTYYHSSAGECSITGGYVYRGATFPDMYGYYFFTDYCHGVISALSTDGNFTRSIAGDFTGKLFSTFGEDSSGELYIADHSSGTIYHLVGNPLSVETPDKDISYSKLYPQPNSGAFTFEFGLANNTPVEIQVTDATGRVLYQRKASFPAGKNTVPVSLSQVAAGAYILQLKTSGGATYHKFVITG